MTNKSYMYNYSRFCGSCMSISFSKNYISVSNSPGAVVGAGTDDVLEVVVVVDSVVVAVGLPVVGRPLTKRVFNHL